MLARQRERNDWDAAHILLQQMQPRIAAQVRAAGVDALQANRVAAVAVEIALNASRDAVGQWILSPHADASSEARWVGVVNGNLRTVQVDRVFRAGAEPLSNDGNTWWIVDYKTAHADGLDPAIALPQLRAVFAPQLEAYAEVLRKLRGSAQIHAGLYYPRMSLFDWWQI
jgi:ATP-dependent exoDNAse (exonuclease V) beta subunit